MKKILVVRGGGRPNGNTAQLVNLTRQIICGRCMNSGKIFILINKTAVFGGKK